MERILDLQLLIPDMDGAAGAETHKGGTTCSISECSFVIMDGFADV